MGKKHRETRKTIKSNLSKIHNRCYGWRENEFGELSKKASKAEARRILLRRYLARMAMENDIIRLANKLAMDDVIAQEDTRVFDAICSV